jgi:ubiquinone/menaquinone biosynthesis C-methylase UbiE
MSDFEKNITADYLRKVADAMKDINEFSYELMCLEEIGSALDAGCGPGADLIPMAKRIRDGGVVTGVDLSESMLVEARKYAQAEGVEGKVSLVCASVTELPFPSSSFDSVRAERLFQVLPPEKVPPQQVFSELFRVLKPGGLMVLIDSDWASASVDFPDLDMERRFVDIFARHCRPNGYSGRHFKRWMVEAGMQEIRLRGFARIAESLDECPLGAWLAEDAVKQGLASSDEASFWLNTLKERDAAGSFYASANMIVVAGRKPI